MSGSGRRNRDLIERTRYPNPIPLPPYPPKLLKIDTPTSRYADGPETQNHAGGNLGLRFTSRLAHANQLPVLVDAEGGMPLDLNMFPGIWTGDLDNVAPSQKVEIDHKTIDPEDAFLLEPLSNALPVTTGAGASVGIYTTAGVNGAATGSTQAGKAPGRGAKGSTADVTWLRRTEYLAMEQQRARKEEKGPQKQEIETSREAMVKRINDTFEKIKKQPLAELRHPTKPGLRAVKTWDLLPDVDTWSTPFQIVRFADWPGRNQDGKPIPDPRVASSVLRPITVGIDARVSFYLISPEDEDGITAAATVEAKTEHAAATKGDDAASATGTSTDAEDDALFGDGTEGQDESAAENKKRKREGQGKAKPTIIESKVLGKHQDAERELAQRYEKRRREGEVVQIPEEEDETIPDEAYTNFKFHRDYQTGDAKDSEITNHYVFVLDDGKDVPVQSRAEKEFAARRTAELDGKDADTVAALAKQAASEMAPTRSTAFWHPVSFRHNLRPKRLKRNESKRYNGMWDRVRIANREVTDVELRKRWRSRKTVDDLDTRLYGEVEDSDVEEMEEGGNDGAIDVDAEGDVSGEGKENRRADADGDETMQEANQSAKERKSEAEDEETEDEAPRKKKKDNEDSDDDEDDDDESLDADEELAALREEAGGQGDEEDVSAGPRRRRAAAVTAEQNTAGNSGDAGDDDDDDE